MRILTIIISLAFFNSSIAQNSDTIFFFKEIGWTINLPTDFKVLDSTENATITNAGKKGIEDAVDAGINVLKTINLISAKKSRNYFNVTLTPYNFERDRDFTEFIHDQKKILYKAMSQDSSVDSISTEMKVGKLIFDKFKMTVHVDEKISFDMILLSSLFKDDYFAIVYVYLDEITKSQIENMLTNSKFLN